MEVFDAEDEEGVFSRVQTRGGGPAGEQRSTADAGGDRGWDFAVDVAELAGDLAAVLDLATRKIVGWSMRDHMRTELPLAALMMAAQRRRPAEGLICHSDRGSQYASETYGRQLIAMKAKPSMSRTACCYDNAPMESFFHTLKVELVHPRRWATREQARPDLFAYIEGYYNRRRIHSALGYRTPEQPERHMA